MTRESKLALIVGFGLILFVGILVSDHFSASQRQEAANLLAKRGDKGKGPTRVSLEALPTGVSPEVIRPREPSSPPPAPEPRHDQLVHGNGSDSNAKPNGNPGGGAIADNDPRIRFYPVKDGETFYSIASSQYGDRSVWQALAEFNKKAVPNPARMHAGVTLRLPPIEMLKPGAIAKRTPENPPAPLTPPGPANTSNPNNPTSIVHGAPSLTEVASATYTVQSGDTLTGIADKKLGSKSKWQAILNVNRDVLKDPDSLVPGTIIKLPTKG